MWIVNDIHGVSFSYVSLFRRTTTSSCNIVRANIECRFLDKKIETIIRHAKHNEIVKWSNILPIRRTSSPFHRPATCICPCWCPIHLWEIEREKREMILFLSSWFLRRERGKQKIYIYILSNTNSPSSLSTSFWSFLTVFSANSARASASFSLTVKVFNWRLNSSTRWLAWKCL